MGTMSSAVIRQISNGWVVTFYIAGTQTTAGNEYEQYYNDLASATAGIATAL